MPLFQATSPGWTQTVLRRHRLKFFEWTHFCSILFFSSNWQTKPIFFIEADPLFLIPRGNGRNPECRPGASVQSFALDPLFLIPFCTNVMRSRHERSNVPKR